MLGFVLFKGRVEYSDIELAHAAVKAGGVRRVAGEEKLRAGVDHVQADARLHSD